MTTSRLCNFTRKHRRKSQGCDLLSPKKGGNNVVNKPMRSFTEKKRGESQSTRIIFSWNEETVGKPLIKVVYFNIVLSTP